MSEVRRMLKPGPSWGAYKRHIRRREVPCEACRRFVNDAVNAVRRARRSAERARVSATVLRAVPLSFAAVLSLAGLPLHTAGDGAA